MTGAVRRMLHFTNKSWVFGASTAWTRF
jgi:hypothetical protein